MTFGLSFKEIFVVFWRSRLKFTKSFYLKNSLVIMASKAMLHEFEALDSEFVAGGLPRIFRL